MTTRQDFARRCHDSSAERSTVAVPCGAPGGRGIEPCRCHLLTPYAAKCKHVGPHVGRCKQDAVTEWSQAPLLPASGQGRGL